MDIWAFPLSAILALAFCVGAYLSYGAYRKMQAATGRTLMMVATVTVAAMTAMEGTWKPDLIHGWPFLVATAVLMGLTGMAALDGMTRRLPLSYVLTHLGLFLIVFGAFFGAPDFREAGMAVNRDEAATCARTSDGMTVPLDFGVELIDFSIDTYDDGVSPKQYTSTLLIDGLQKTTAVNKPCFHKGWLIYQADYDRNDGAYSVLRLVRDPWLPFVLIGMAVLALGAVLELKKTWHSRAVIPAVLGLAVLFGGISLAKISFGTLPPALRSLWFVPHLIIYMLAYSVLALSLLAAIAGKQELGAKLLGTASALLILGMLCGAAWAKVAWGDYWTWDAKECWAAVTWLLTLAGTHLKFPCKKHKFALVILLAFLAMQVTWYGVNYLPSAEHSMHTYTK